VSNESAFLMKICVMKIPFYSLVLFLFSFSFSAQGITGLRYHFPVIDLADGQDKSSFSCSTSTSCMHQSLLFLSVM
jgi:hypothetical protein